MQAWLLAESVDAPLVLAVGLALCRDRPGVVEGLAVGEELAVHRGCGADVQGVALAAPYGHAVVEGGPLGGVQFGRVKEVGDLARHVEGDRQLRGWGVLVAGGALGHEVGDGRADGSPADAVFAGQGCDGPALQVRGAHGVGLIGRDGRAPAALAALGFGGPQPVVGQLAL
ncbi:hypothetical protein ACH4PR_47095 [Streptomyces mirabilis]|uniref:hypothetical protein n=1 Tax=Streptomyces mirabilis TaxID=68239 RepID=UPI003788A725